MLITTTLSGGFPFAITAIAIYMDYDTTEYILRFVLNDQMYWDTKTVYYTLVFRAFLLFMVGLEISRSGSYFLCCLFIFGDQGSKTVECMKSLRFPIFAYLYTLLRLMYGKIRNWFNWFVYLLETTFFWGTVISCYFVIECWENVNLAIYVGAIIGVMIFALIQITLLPNAVDSIALTRKVVEIQQTKVKTLLAHQKSKSNLKLVKVVMGIQPITVLCGSFKVINREFLREHFELLLLRIFDAIMIS